MSWRFRRSIRLPGGFRINLSRRGIGYSSGIPGVRFGRDASGRNYQAYSVPGTGLYSRSYSKGEQRATSETGSFWNWFGFGIFLGLFLGLLRVIRKSPGCGCLLLLILLALPLMLLKHVSSFVREIPMPLLIAVGVVSIILLVSRHFEFQFQRGDDTITATNLAASQPSVQPLGTEAPPAVPHKGHEQFRADSLGIAGTTASHVRRAGGTGAVSSAATSASLGPGAVPAQPEAKVQSGCAISGEDPVADFAAKVRETIADAIQPALKEALRPVRMASSARSLIEMEFIKVIYGFGLDDGGQLSYQAACVYAQVFGRLNKSLAGISAEIVQRTAGSYIETHRADLADAEGTPEILRHLQVWDRAHGTAAAKLLRDILLQLAILAAEVNGSVPETKSRRIEQFAAAMDAS